MGCSNKTVDGMVFYDFQCSPNISRAKIRRCCDGMGHGFCLHDDDGGGGGEKMKARIWSETQNGNHLKRHRRKDIK